MSITDELRKAAVKTECANGRCEKLYRGDLERIADRIDAAVKGMVELPKDADDVPWNICDRDEDGNVVTQLRLSSDGWYAITDGLSAFHPEQRRHYHAPTVEDVLREFAYGLGVPVADSYIAATAAKLRLAEGED